MPWPSGHQRRYVAGFAQHGRDKETDKFFLAITLRGVTRNGAVYMPPFKGILPQEAIWAIRSYTESQPKVDQTPRH